MSLMIQDVVAKTVRPCGERRFDCFARRLDVIMTGKDANQVRRRSGLTSDNTALQNTPNPRTIRMLSERESEILESWIENRVNSPDFRETLISGEEMTADSQSFLRAFVTAIANSNVEEMRGKEFNAIRRLLLDISEARAAQAFSPSETVTPFRGSLPRLTFWPLVAIRPCSSVGSLSGSWRGSSLES